MPKNQPPSQLKLYTEREHTAYERDDKDVIDQLCSAFQQVTGYDLTFHTNLDEPPRSANSDGKAVVFPLPDGKRETVPTLELSTTACGEATSERATEDTFAGCRLFAETIGNLIGKLHTTRLALRDREGELAAAVPLVCDPDEDRRQVAERLESVLQAGVAAVDCSAAALYLLDDFTQHLKLRSHFGLSDDRFAEPPRELRQATADLEALVGHAVVLEKPASFATWNAPGGFGSAVCVPVSTATVPLGTMWFFDESPRDYDDREVGLIEVVAGRLAAEVEREILLRSRLEGHSADEPLVRDWIKLSWPTIPELSGWQAATIPGADDTLPHGALLHRLEAGQFQLASAASTESGLRGALMNAGWVAACAWERSDTAPTRIAEQLQAAAARVSFEESPICTWCATLDLGEGALEYCQTGSIEAYIIRPHAWELLGVSEPRLAAPDRPTAASGRTILEPGDSLFVITGARAEPKSTPVSPEPARRIDGAHLAELILRHSHQTPEETLRLLRSLLHRHRHTWTAPPGLLLMHRD